MFVTLWVGTEEEWDTGGRGKHFFLSTEQLTTNPADICPILDNFIMGGAVMGPTHEEKFSLYANVVVPEEVYPVLLTNLQSVGFRPVKSLRNVQSINRRNQFSL